MSAFLAALTQKFIENSKTSLTTVNFELYCRGQHLLTESQEEASIFII